MGVQDDWFQLGGHSLLATRLFARIEKATAVTLPMAALLEGATIKHLAALIDQRQAPRGPARDAAPPDRGFARLVPMRCEGRLPPLFCVHGAGGNVLNLQDVARHLSPDRPFYAFQARGLDGQTPPHTSIEAMAEEYLAELRSVQAAGPYYLSGYCGGGLVAYEMAQRLGAAGEQVRFLGIIDLYWPGISFKETRRQRWLRLLREGTPRQVLGKLRAKLSRDALYQCLRARVWLRTALGRAVPFALRDFWLTREFYLAMTRYALAPYAGRVAVFRARDGGYEYLRDPGPDLGWGPLALQGVDAREVPGDHDTVMREPNVQILAQQVEDAIAHAEEAPLQRHRSA
ncbi:MAG: thioesterase domain-containing protein [Anaeromyxobacter sp.]